MNYQIRAANLRGIFFSAIFALASFASLANIANAREPAKPLQRLENCRWIQNESNDGDSFHVSWKGKEFIFRIYFVDAPETENRFPERVQDQAKYFGITPKQAIEIGKIAATFTRNKLAKPFTVYTRWTDARGSSRLERFYAFIVIDDKQLSDLLVANGLGRIFGMPANLPNGTTATAYIAQLHQLEAKAKADRLGAWSLQGGAALKTENAASSASSSPASNWPFSKPAPSPKASSF